MIRLLMILFLLGHASLSHAAFGDVLEVVDETSGAGSVATLSGTYASATPTANDLNVVFCMSGDGPTAIDTAGFTDDLIMTNATEDDGSILGSQLVTGAGDNTVTCSQPGADELGLILILVDGDFSASPLDLAAGSGRTTANPAVTAVSGSSTAQADEFMVAIEALRATTNITAAWDRLGTATPTTALTEQGPGSAMAAKRVEAAAGVLSGGGTVGMSRANTAGTVVMIGYATYKKAGGAPAPSTASPYRRVIITTTE